MSYFSAYRARPGVNGIQASDIPPPKMYQSSGPPSSNDIAARMKALTDAGIGKESPVYRLVEQQQKLSTQRDAAKSAVKDAAKTAAKMVAKAAM